MADDDGDGTPPGSEGEGTDDGSPPPGKHVAADRAAVRSLREAPHSIAALDRMLAEALAEDEAEGRRGDTPS